MRLGLRELRRRPGRFLVVGGALTVLAVLLLLLGGLLDGLFLGSTGAIRAQRADVVVYAAEARQSFVRSRLGAEVRQAVADVDGVAEVGGLGVALVGAAVPGQEALVDAAVFGYELAPEGLPAPPPPGQAVVDATLADAGVEDGDQLRLGPAAVVVTVVGFVEDTSYLGQGGVWVDLATWREVLAASRPGAGVADDVVQALVVQAGDDVAPAALAQRVDAATGGATRSLTRDEAVLSLPGTAEQNAVFQTLIGVALLVVGLVTALFFALLTIERTALYATLKAVGARSSSLFAGLVVQAVAVAVGAFALGALAAWALAAVIPPEVPVTLVPSRALTTGALLVAAAALGGAVSLRRIVRVDPASAIG